MILIKTILLISLICGGQPTPDNIARRPVAPAPIAYPSSVIQLQHVSVYIEGQGSAVVIRQEGRTVYAITCNHCIPSKGTILFADRNVAFTVAQLPKYDLAVIRFQSDRRYPVTPFAAPRIDLPVRIIGYRRNHRQIRRGTITHDAGKGMMGVAGGFFGGFSGGGVFNERGRLVGIVSAVAVMGLPESDLGIAIRGDLAERFVQDAFDPQ